MGWTMAGERGDLRRWDRVRVEAGRAVAVRTFWEALATESAIVATLEVPGRPRVAEEGV